MRSDTVKTGIQQAPHRSLFNALGLTEEELQKPQQKGIRSEEHTSELQSH